MTLPPPEPGAARVSAELTALIRAEIEASGPLPFDRFWQMAQFHPRLGYYHNGLHKFGAGGDFVTAPELGAVFGTALAQWLAGALAGLPENAVIIEAGAGSGALAATVLTALATLDRAPSGYLILEVSAELRDRQRATLQRRAAHLLPLVDWIDAPPAAWSGVLVGNEVVDALPARRYRYDGERWTELRVTSRGAALDFEAFPAEPGGLPEQDWTTGQVVDLQPLLDGWIDSVTAGLRQGAVWLADYGYVAREYFHPQRVAGTAIAHYRQRAHDDLLALPGLQDLSVSIDFSRLARALERAGLTVAGFTSQAQFLIEHGLEGQIQAAQDLPDAERFALMGEIKRLTLPAEMGERFSVMTATRDLPLPPPAADQRGRL